MKDRKKIQAKVSERVPPGLVRCFLKNNEAVYEDECPVKRGTRKVNRRCETCDFSRPTKEPVLFDHPDSIAGAQNSWKEHYREGRGSLNILRAFNHAVECQIAIPTWVNDCLYQAFSSYLKAGNNLALDSFLHLTSRGPRSVKDRSKRQDRNIQLVTHIDALVRTGFHVLDAVKITWEYFCDPERKRKLEDSIPSPDKLRSMYFSLGKKLSLKSITRYPGRWSQDMIQFVLRLTESPRCSAETKKHFRTITKKYPEIFSGQPK